MYIKPESGKREKFKYRCSFYLTYDIITREIRMLSEYPQTWLGVLAHCYSLTCKCLHQAESIMPAHVDHVDWPHASCNPFIRKAITENVRLETWLIIWEKKMVCKSAAIIRNADQMGEFIASTLFYDLKTNFVQCIPVLCFEVIYVNKYKCTQINMWGI